VSNPLVSFVVPCYNYGRYLPDCLSSIFQQDAGVDFEIIAIDDASTDHTRELLSGYANDPRVRVILHEKNRGHIFTVNEGLAAARGSFIARIDPDDRYRPGFLVSVMEKFRQYPEVGLVYGNVALINEHGHVNVENAESPHEGDFKGNEFLALLKCNFICAPTTIARREAWQQALPIPTGLAFNDWYLNLEMARRFDFYYIRRVLADYRVHSANHHTKVSRDKSEEASVFWLLDQVYGQKENSAHLETAKRRAKRRVYAAQYLSSADKYFSHMMNEDARRCYWNAIRRQPSCLLQFGVFRRFAATMIGRQWYEAGKALWKRNSSVRASWWGI
jgi:glycosyltransferase involved in cell wall biosynthesis